MAQKTVTHRSPTPLPALHISSLEICLSSKDYFTAPTKRMRPSQLHPPHALHLLHLLCALRFLHPPCLVMSPCLPCLLQLHLPPSLSGPHHSLMITCRPCQTTAHLGSTKLVNSSSSSTPSAHHIDRHHPSTTLHPLLRQLTCGKCRTFSMSLMSLQSHTAHFNYSPLQNDELTTLSCCPWNAPSSSDRQQSTWDACCFQ